MKPLLLAVFIVVGLSLKALGDIPPPFYGSFSQGIVCDTEEQLVTKLDMLSVGDTTPFDGCGFPQLPERIPAGFIPLYWYDVRNAAVLITRVEIPRNDGVWVQYSYIQYVEHTSI